MTSADDETITWAELIQAFRATTFPDHPDRDNGHRSTLPSLALATAEEIADRLFQVVQAQREARRWIAARLYVSYPPGATTPWVYQRTSPGWIGVNNGEEYDDGDLDTTGFRLLIPEGEPAHPAAAYFNENLPMPAPTVPGAAPRAPRLPVRYPLGGPSHIHGDDGTVEGCPGCFPGPTRTRATDSEH